MDPLYKCPDYRGRTRDGGAGEGIDVCARHPLGSYGINAEGVVPFPQKKFLGLDGRTPHLHEHGTIALTDATIFAPAEMISLGDANLTAFDWGYPEYQQEYISGSKPFWGSGAGDLNYYMGRGDMIGGPTRDPILRNSTRQRHNDRFNLSFADGHIENFKSERLFSRTAEVRKLWNNDNQPHPELP